MENKKQEEGLQMNLKGKTIVFLGSSVTYGSASDGYSMCEYINEKTGADVKKWALSGTTLADINENSYVNRLKLHIDSQKQCDLFICQLSTNDTSRDVSLGEISDYENEECFDVSTVAGAIEYIIARVKNKWNCPIAFYTGTFFESDMYQKMVDLLFDLQKKWDFDVIDLWNDKQMRNVDKNAYERYMSNPIHPTKEGYAQWWGPKFVDYLRKFENKQ